MDIVKLLNFYYGRLKVVTTELGTIQKINGRVQIDVGYEGPLGQSGWVGQRRFVKKLLSLRYEFAMSQLTFPEYLPHPKIYSYRGEKFTLAYIAGTNQSICAVGSVDLVPFSYKSYNFSMLRSIQISGREIPLYETSKLMSTLFPPWT